MGTAYGRSGGSVVRVGSQTAPIAVPLNGGLSITTSPRCEGSYVSAAD
jgi:hypothetical protein